mmetsp:Transcript_92846/g.165092  ORF Transcript_92846/g.165092 Transcript_92846/m.165092 type:complete len:98 (-) Transcript_92846:231-524(-)
MAELRPKIATYKFGRIKPKTIFSCCKKVEHLLSHLEVLQVESKSGTKCRIRLTCHSDLQEAAKKEQQLHVARQATSGIPRAAWAIVEGSRHPPRQRG